MRVYNLHFTVDGVLVVQHLLFLSHKNQTARLVVPMPAKTNPCKQRNKPAYQCSQSQCLSLCALMPSSQVLWHLLVVVKDVICNRVFSRDHLTPHLTHEDESHHLVDLVWIRLCLGREEKKSYVSMAPEYVQIKTSCVNHSKF